MNNKTPWDVFGIAEDHTFNEAEIKRMYRELVSEFHPDRAKDKEQADEWNERTAEILWAYGLLTDTAAMARWKIGAPKGPSATDVADDMVMELAGVVTLSNERINMVSEMRSRLVTLRSQIQYEINALEKRSAMQDRMAARIGGADGNALKVIMGQRADQTKRELLHKQIGLEGTFVAESIIADFVDPGMPSEAGVTLESRNVLSGDLPLRVTYV